MSKVLLIAEAANPEWVSVPLVGWSLAKAISEKTPSHIVTQVRNRAAFLRAGLVEGRDFTSIDSEKFARPISRIGNALRGGAGVGWTTLSAITTASYYYFESLVWRQFGHEILSGHYDVVHRITPLSPTIPSLLAARCAKASSAFILGPLNGGIPWPREFLSARLQEREWLSFVRSAYKFLPAYRSTIEKAEAIITGSRWTLNELPMSCRAKCIYIPENGIDPARFSPAPIQSVRAPLRACFVGRLVPYKGADMLLEAVAPILKAGKLELDIIGSGPQFATLQDFVKCERLQTNVHFHGWVPHEQLQPLIKRAQLLLFPSIREFGGGVVLEAMALGIVPVVVDYGGPAELVTDATGYKIPLGRREEIIKRLRETVSGLCDFPSQLHSRAAAAIQRVKTLFTWEAKANQIVEIYTYVRRNRAAAAIKASLQEPLMQEIDCEGLRYG